MLITGGYLTPRVLTASCEIYDPATNGWIAAASMSTTRTNQTAALLSNGRVLVTGVSWARMVRAAPPGCTTLSKINGARPAVGEPLAHSIRPHCLRPARCWWWPGGATG